MKHLKELYQVVWMLAGFTFFAAWFGIHGLMCIYGAMTGVSYLMVKAAIKAN